MDTDALMKQLMVLLDGVTDTEIARAIILPVLQEYGEGIPEEVLVGMADILFLEIIEEQHRRKAELVATVGRQTQADDNKKSDVFETVCFQQQSVAAAPHIAGTVFFSETSPPPPSSPKQRQEISVSDNMSSPNRQSSYSPPCSAAREEPADPRILSERQYPPLVVPRHTTAAPVVQGDPHPIVPDDYARKQVEDSAPLWIVDWGGTLPMAGAILSPRFLLLAPRFTSKPWVQMELDERLHCPYWNRTPSLALETDGTWSYYEKLNIDTDDTYTAGREYLLRIRIVFHEDEGRRTCCYQGTMRLKAPDPSRNIRTLEISGDGASLINLSSADLAEFQRVRITGGDQTLVNVQRGWAPPDAATPELRHHLVEMRLKPDITAQYLVPRRATVSVTPFRSEHVVLRSENGEQAFYVFAKPNLLFGRAAEESLTEEACDVVTWIYHPKFDEIELYDESLVRASRFLTRLLSRNHCETEIQPRGLKITDKKSTLGTFVGDRPLDSQILAEWKHLTRGVSLVVGGILEMYVKAHVDPTWDRLFSFGFFRNDDFEEFYRLVAFGGVISFHAQGMSGLWKLAEEQKTCDAIVFSRQKQLVFEQYREEIIRRIRLRTDEPEPILEELERSVRKCRHDPFARNREYIMLLRSATIGNGRTDAIVLPNSGLGEGVARILSMNNMFWLEPLHTDPSPIRIDGHELSRNELVPLSPGQTVTFGERTFFIDRFDEDRR